MSSNAAGALGDTAERLFMPSSAGREWSPSILFPDRGERPAPDGGEPPAYFRDLNLDQVLQLVTVGRSRYDLAPFFSTPLRSLRAIAYRHEVFRDLESQVLRGAVHTFAQQMLVMHDQLARGDRLRHRHQKHSLFLAAIQTYCDAVTRLTVDLGSLPTSSDGFDRFRTYLTGYVRSDDFRALCQESRLVRDQLAGVRYCLHITAGRVTVRRYGAEEDYSSQVTATFAKFRQAVSKDHLVNFHDTLEMNHVEEGVLDRVERLYPQVFTALDRYCDQHSDFLDETIRAFDREVQFYVAYLELVDCLRVAGLDFCYPDVSDQSKTVFADDTFDIALAAKLVDHGSSIVRNNISLHEPERIIVVSGPNQGGKTTLARTFGQLHHLAAVGCPVPGRQARLFLFDQLLTHFEREEVLKDLRGKLQDDLLRARELFDRATTRSVVILNEIFSSTTLQDAVALGRKILDRLVDLDVLCVCVTFTDEFSTMSKTTVSMVSEVDPDDPAIRTFKVVRKPPEGTAYALAIAEKYGLTYETLRKRIQP